MTACRYCEYLGCPCPQHDRPDGCTCPADDVISVGCEAHAHLIDVEPTEVAA